MNRTLRLTKFRDLSITDAFFDSLKASYQEFPEWFSAKAEEDVYVAIDDDGSSESISGMIYLKIEDRPVEDVVPPLPNSRWLKVGTLKIEGRGTKLGERVLKKIFDTAVHENADGVYVTVFHAHGDLIALFKRFGFTEHGIKITDNGTELVLTKSLIISTDDILHDYPRFKIVGRRYWLLAVYPEYHSRLLPDSILNNEPIEIVRDVSYTNTIEKIYVGKLILTRMSPGDLVVIYRTTDHQAPAYYRSVATSVCVIQETRSKLSFPSAEAFVEYCLPHSVFSEDELVNQFLTSNRLYTAKMTYNAAFGRRTTRGRLLDEAHISDPPRWDMRSLSEEQFRRILDMGSVNVRLAID